MAAFAGSSGGVAGSSADDGVTSAPAGAGATTGDGTNTGAGATTGAGTSTFSTAAPI